MDHVETGNEYVSEITSELSILLQVDESKPERILGTGDPNSKWKRGGLHQFLGKLNCL